MKVLVCLLLAMLLLYGCGVATTPPEPIDVNIEEPFADRILEIDGLSVDDVQAIWRFDNSSPPEAPTRIVYREMDLKLLLEALQAVQLTGPEKSQSTAAPGDYWSYRIDLFNGETIDIHFNSGYVVSQGENYSYRNSAAVQQTMDELEEDPNLLHNDAYETVEKVTITTASGERTVTDRKKIEEYVRMFYWMTITGRSRETLADGITYTFHHKDGKEIVFRYHGNLLATAEGTFQVKTNPEYLITESSD